MTSRRGIGRRRRRRGWASLARAAALLSAAAALALVVVVVVLLNPPRERPTNADVVVVIAGSSDGRHELAAELVHAGVADNLVVSHPGGRRGDPVGYALCRGEGVPENINIWCMDPQPPTTTGEVQTFERLAREQGWRTAVATTNRPHHYRVRLNFSQCSSVRATVASISELSPRETPYLVAREIGGFAKHFLTRPCR